jgi:hypothetical protein
VADADVGRFTASDLLSASVMIGQNRQSNFQQAKANHDFKEQELESKPTRG